jgi:glycosyltransferase involved in cell wall biosynthesis
LERLSEKLKYNSAIVIFNHGALGGAVKRYVNLFIYFRKIDPDKIILITNSHLFNQFKELYPDEKADGIYIVNDFSKTSLQKPGSSKTRVYKDRISDPMETDSRHTIFRKIYWYYKNKFRQKKIYGQIEELREQLDIKVFYGVFAGILPLMFYMESKRKDTAVLFSDMDSWFSEVHRDMKKLWYRKYYSFNYALENADAVDFLSPHIYEGVKERNVNLNKEKIFISPCSFTDYRKCETGDKSRLEIAYVHRIEPDKNPMMFLNAVKRIIEKFPGLKIHLLGEGTLVNEVDSFIKENKLEKNIEFRFHPNPTEILKNTLIFVSIQTLTNYPSQSVLEAMACGNAIIASCTGDTGLFINEQNGILIDLNEDSLVAALEDLLENKKKAIQLGKNAREYVLKNHAIETFADYFIKLLNETYEKKIKNIL